MENNVCVFTPASGIPTVKKLNRVTLIFIGVMTVGCIAVTLINKPKHNGLVFILVTYITLCLFVIAARFTIRYIVEIWIDPIEGTINWSFIDHVGKKGVKKIKIKSSIYSYKVQVTRDYTGYILTIKDENSTLQVRETKSKNKDLTNVFLRGDLDRMNNLICEIKLNI